MREGCGAAPDARGILQRGSVAQTVLLGHAPLDFNCELADQSWHREPLLQTSALKCLAGCAVTSVCLRHPQPEKTDVLSGRNCLVKSGEGGRVGGEG